MTHSEPADPNLQLEEEEPASIKRVPGAKLALWESLLKPRGFIADQGKLVRSPSKSQSQAAGGRGMGVGSQGDESPQEGICIIWLLESTWKKGMPDYMVLMLRGSPDTFYSVTAPVIWVILQNVLWSIYLHTLI